MKILITGASGYLGSWLTRRLRQNGHEISILKRSFSDVKRISDILPFIAIYNIDQQQPETILSIARPDVILHTATCYGRAGQSYRAVADTNVFFPLRLLEAAAVAGVSAFINTDTVLDRYTNRYSLSKSQFTDWGKLYVQEGKGRFVNICLEHMYGPGDDSSKFTTYIINSLRKNVYSLDLTEGKQIRDFIYIEDVVSAYERILDYVVEDDIKFLNYEVGSGQPVTIRHFVETVAEVTEANTKLRFGAIAYRPNEKMESHSNIEPLRRLGWTPSVLLRDGIRQCILEDKDK